MNLSNTIGTKAEPARLMPICPDPKPRVVKVDLTSNKTQPPAAILVKYLDPSLNNLNSMKTSMYIPIMTNDSNKSSPRLVMGVKPVPVFGQRHRPIVPIMPRHNLELNSIVSFGKQFSSTTIVGGASQCEATIFHGPLTQYERYIKAHPNLENTSIENANLIVQRNEIVLETLEKSSNTVVSEDNEVQTIHMLGDFPNNKKEALHPAIKETFMSTKASPGTCIVSFEGPSRPAGLRNKGQGHCFKTWRVVGNGRSRMLGDYHTSIPVSDFKAQLNDTSDIVGTVDVAPPIKNIIRLLHRGNSRVFTAGKMGVTELFENPGSRLSSKILRTFTRHLNTRPLLTEETFPDMELLPVGHTPKVDLTKVKRITRKRFYPEAEEYRRNLCLKTKEPTPFRFEHFVTVNDSMETEFLHEEEIIPDSYVTDPIFVEESLVGLKKDAHDGVMCLYGDDVTIESDNILEEHHHTLPDGSTVIMLQEDQTQDGTRPSLKSKNIEVLLTAAEKQGISRTNIQKVIFCQSENRDNL